jgi:hypothetical protein
LEGGGGGGGGGGGRKNEFEVVVGGFGCACSGAFEDGVKAGIVQVCDDNELALVVGRRLGKDDMLTSGVTDLDIGCIGRIGCSIEELGAGSFDMLVALLEASAVDHAKIGAGACCGGCRVVCPNDIASEGESFARFPRTRRSKSSSVPIVDVAKPFSVAFDKLGSPASDDLFVDDSS